MCYVSFVIKATFHNISAKGRRTDSARLYCLLKYYFNIFFRYFLELEVEVNIILNHPKVGENFIN